MSLEQAKQAVDAAGHADSEVRRGGQATDDVAVIVQEHVAVGPRGGFFAVVVGDEFAVRQPDHHESAATEVPGGGVGHGQSETDGDCGVDGVAPTAQHLDSHLRRLRRPRSHRALVAARFLRAVARQASAYGDHGQCRRCRASTLGRDA